MTAWVRARDDEGVLSREQRGMVVGGLATTMPALSSGMLVIARDPGCTCWLRGGEAGARAFANEVVRHESPSIVGGVPYYAACDVELSGVGIPADGQVRTMPAAANRDPAVFSDPDRFDPARDGRNPLDFGHGTHHCLGMNLSMLQMTKMFTMLHRRFPDLALAGQPQ